MMPGNPVVGGVALRRPAVQSPNYVAGSTGWSINADGSAEFSNAIIRGTIFGSNVELNANGAFFYAGAPGLGTLVLSLANSDGTDEYGNGYLAGVTVYDPTTGLIVQLIEGGVQMISNLDSFLLQANPTTDELDITCTNGAMTLKLAPTLATLTGGDTQVDDLLTYGGIAGTITKTFSSSGTLAVPAGTTGTARIQAWAGGGGGGSGGGAGGGGGEYAEEPASPITPGGTVTVTIGAGGSGGAAGAFHNGTAGGNTTVTGGGVTTVTAHGGGAGQTSGSRASGGSGSTNSIHHNGGSSGLSSSSRGGAGGGGAGGTIGGGGSGGDATGDRTPGGGGSGGNSGGGVGSGGGWGTTSSGGSTGSSNGGSGGSPGGAGGGGGYNGVSAGSSQAGGAGAKGKVILTYTVTATGLIAAVSGVAGTDSAGNAFGVGFTGPAQAFTPGSSPKTLEGWHSLSLPGGLSGAARYKLVAEASIVLLDIVVSWTTTSATTFTLGSLPAAYSASTPGGLARIYTMAGNATMSAAGQLPRLFVSGTSVQVVTPATTGGGTAACTVFCPLN
jgi:hypothetical protein